MVLAWRKSQCPFWDPLHYLEPPKMWLIPLAHAEPSRASLRPPPVLLKSSWAKVTHLSVRKSVFFSHLPGYPQFWHCRAPDEVLNSMLTPTRLMSECQITCARPRFYPCCEMNRIWRLGKWEREILSFSPSLINGFTPHVRLWMKWLFINFQFEMIKLIQVLKGYYFTKWDKLSFANYAMSLYLKKKK